MTTPKGKNRKRRDGVNVRFGAAVAYYRVHRYEGTQQMLADAMGKTRSTIASIESGRQGVFLSDVLLFAKVFNMDPNVLVKAAEGDK